MKILIGTIAALIMGAFLSVASVTPAVADTRCGDLGSDACEVFLRQQNAPRYNGPIAPTTEPVRCAYVVSNEATALVLRKGVGTNGPEVTSWRRTVLDWRDGKVNGRAVKIAQICFPVRYLFAADAFTLCGEIGNSVWRNANIEFIRENDIDRFDPACVGGDGWCGFRGL